MYMTDRCLSISKLFCTNGYIWGGGEGEAGRLELFLPLGVGGRGGAGELVLTSINSPASSSN